MSKMKKVFSIISAAIAVMIIALLVTLSLVKRNFALSIDNPSKIMIYNRSATAFENGFEEGSTKYNEALKKFKEITNLSIFDWLIHENTLEYKPSQDVDNGFSKYSSDMKTEYVAVEMLFTGENNQQDIIVSVDGATKVVSFDCIMVILPLNNSFSDIVVYYSLGSSNYNEQYKLCEPIILKGRAGVFVDYVNSLTEKSN